MFFAIQSFVLCIAVGVEVGSMYILFFILILVYNTVPGICWVLSKYLNKCSYISNAKI